MNRHWTVKLDDVAEINPRAPKHIADDDDVAFVPMSAVSENGSLGEHGTRPYAEVKKGYTYFQRGDILVAKITPCFENGKAALVDNLVEPTGFGSTEFHVLRPGPDLDGRYLFYMLWNEKFRAVAAGGMTGSAGQKRVPAELLRRTEIRLPPLDEQRRIAAILDQADALRQKRKRAIALLDSLTQLIFLEMFGDPSTNIRGYPVLPLGRVASKFSDGPFGSNLKSEHYVEEGVRVIRLQNIGVGEFVDEDTAYISVEHFLKLAKHECLPGDVLIATLGDPNLRAFVQPASLAQALNKADCVQLRPNLDCVLPEYICALINLPSVMTMASGLVLGQTRGRISMGRLRDLELPIAPLDEQRRFVQAIGVRSALHASAHKNEMVAHALFASLQHRAFSGQL